MGVSGSLKGDSANSALLRAIRADGAHQLEVWDGLGDLPHFSPDGDGGAPVGSLRAVIAGCDAVLIATPEYAGGMPGSLKNALDWLVGSGELYGRPVAVVSAAPTTERGGNARQWVEDVVRMQGGRVVASFTTAIPAAADEHVLSARAGEVWDRVVDAVAQAMSPVPAAPEHGSGPW